MKKHLSLILLTSLLIASAEAKVSSQEAALLGESLTALGAEKAGNSEGTIPAYEGGIRSPINGYKKGKPHPDPYGEDQPLFTITADNMDQYEDRLSAGQRAMFRRYGSSWKMNVYPTRRSAAFPDWVEEAVKANATTAELTKDGNGVTNATISSPFPIPQNGHEAIWNHLLRYRGETIERTVLQAAPTSGGSYTTVTIEEKVLIPYNQQGNTIESLDNRLAYLLQTVTAPAYLAGQILLVHDTINQNKEPRLAWTYNPGQRRVRRAPNIAFDNPGTASDGQRTTDQFDMFSGSPERYNWTLVGKRELYVPYNAYELHSDRHGTGEILATGHMNPDLLRYELHRVWEVEASVKDGTSHIYAKRTFFLDEDSWQILLVDQYDSRGNIWRVSEAHCINYYQVPLLWDTVLAHYDLVNGRYLVFGMNNKQGMEEFGIKLSKGDFTPERLRRMGRR